MATENGVVTLLDLMTLTRQESDMVNSQFITEPELVSFISNSYKDLYNLVVGAYGEDYYAAIPATFTTVGNQDKYDLPTGNNTFTDNDGNSITPPAFYKLLGVDFQLNRNNVMGYVTLKKFTFSERNKFAVPNFANFWGFTNLRYRLLGNQIWLTPVPMAGQNIRLYYIPRPTNLINTIQMTTTASSVTATVTDINAAAVGMSVFGENIAPNTTIVSNVSGTVTLSEAALGTGAIPVQVFDYNTTIDGVAGWEEYIVIDAAIKCKDKEESDVSVLAARKNEKKKEIESIAENRDPGTASRVADVQSNGYNSDGSGNGWGWGGDW